MLILYLSFYLLQLKFSFGYFSESLFDPEEDLHRHHIVERSLLFPQYTVLQVRKKILSRKFYYKISLRNPRCLSLLQFTYGVSVPVILPNRTFQLSVCVQSNYDLPFNISNFTPVIFTARENVDSVKEPDGFDIDRFTFYNYIIDFIDR